MIVESNEAIPFYSAEFEANASDILLTQSLAFQKKILHLMCELVYLRSLSHLQ